MKAKFIFSLICVAAVTLTACEEYPYGYGYGGYRYSGGYGYPYSGYGGYGGYGYPYGGYGYGGYGAYRPAARPAVEAEPHPSAQELHT